MRAGPVNCQILLGGERDRDRALGWSVSCICQCIYYRHRRCEASPERGKHSAQSMEKDDPELGSVFDYLVPGLVFWATQRITSNIQTNNGRRMSSHCMELAIFYAGIVPDTIKY